MAHNFCTLFDKNFLARGLALHRSLIEQCPNFILWILCMDDEGCSLLEKLKLDKVKLLKLAEVEDDRLRAVKSTRTAVEYCWMFSSSLPLYILEKNPSLDMITYLDADMYFYSPVDEIYQEFENNSIMIIPHGFSRKNQFREKSSGLYNVGMMIFRNDHYSLACLSWWKDRCLEWCYNFYEDGKFGDQLYLNDWPTRFKKVYVLTNLGANVAPWNIDRYRFRMKNGRTMGTEKITDKKFPLIFYHFHGLKIYMNDNGKISPYPVTMHEPQIYRLYIRALQEVYDHIRIIEPSWVYGCVKKLDIIRVIKQYIIIWTVKKYL